MTILEFQSLTPEERKQWIAMQSFKTENKRKKMQFHEKVMLFACIVAAYHVLFASYSWIMWREVPDVMIEGAKWLFTACMGFYMGYLAYTHNKNGPVQDRDPT